MLLEVVCVTAIRLCILRRTDAIDNWTEVLAKGWLCSATGSYRTLNFRLVLMLIGTFDPSRMLKATCSSGY